MMGAGLTLDEVSEFIVDCPHRTAPTEETGIPQIRTTDIRRGHLDLAGANRVSEATYREWIARAEPKAGDLILAREAPVGEIGAVPAGSRVCLGQRTVLVRPDERHVNPRFLLFLLLDHPLQAEMKRLAAGSTTPHLNVADIRRLRLPTLPERATQNAVAATLGALDDKIEVNRRMRETLEEIARALFQSSFMDFDPVRGTGTVSEDVGRLFPDRLAGSTIGPVPEGWGVAPLSTLITVSRDSVDPRDYPEELFDHYSLPAFDAGKRPAGERGRDIRSSKLGVPDGCVLLSKLNPRIPRVWWPSRQGSQRRIASTEFVVALPRAAMTRSYLFGLFTAIRFRASFASLVRGTSGSHQRVSVADLLAIEVVVAPRALVERFEAIVAPMFEQREALSDEPKTLAELRDTLLPELLSGRVRVAGSEGT